MAAGWDPVSKKPTLCPALIGLKIYGRRSLAVAFLIRPGLVELCPSGLRVGTECLCGQEGMDSNTPRRANPSGVVRWH